MKTVVAALGLCASVALCPSSSIAATISVAAGSDLQSAIVNAKPGDTILLARGVVYVGNFTLTDKGSSTGSTAMITIRTDGDSGLAADGQRVSPSMAPLLAKLQSPSNGAPVISTAPNAHHWKLMLVEIVGNSLGDLIDLGDGGETSLARVPHDIVLDRVYAHGDPTLGQKRGVALNSASTTITGSYISDIKAVGQDTQAICGWNGPGPFVITNNYLEAAAENVLFGGADPGIKNLVPADIMFSGNLVSKPVAWRSQGWTVKNLFELKNARRVFAANNIFEYTWEGGQSGYAILFTVRNQDGGCPWCQVDHVTFSGNVVRHSGAGIQMLGSDYNYPSQQTQTVLIQNNVFWDIDSQNWGGNGYFISIVNAPRDLTIDHNTIISDHGSGVVQVDGPPVLEFKFTNNLAKHNSYGFIGTSHAYGSDTISAFFPASEITCNVLAGGSANLYPAGNSFPTTDQFAAQFVSYTGGDYHLVASSPWHKAALDGQDMGAPFNGAAAAPSTGWTPHRR